jgi:hypothetical protein
VGGFMRNTDCNTPIRQVFLFGSISGDDLVMSVEGKGRGTTTISYASAEGLCTGSMRHCLWLRLQVRPGTTARGSRTPHRPEPAPPVRPYNSWCVRCTGPHGLDRRQGDADRLTS